MNDQMQAISQTQLEPEVLELVTLPVQRACSSARRADRLGMSALADLVDAGQLAPTVAATFPFDQAATDQSAGAGPGQVVLTFPTT